jgi:hypothetical protein
LHIFPKVRGVKKRRGQASLPAPGDGNQSLIPNDGDPAASGRTPRSPDLSDPQAAPVARCLAGGVWRNRRETDPFVTAATAGAVPEEVPSCQVFGVLLGRHDDDRGWRLHHDRLVSGGNGRQQEKQHQTSHRNPFHAYRKQNQSTPGLYVNVSLFRRFWDTFWGHVVAVVISGGEAE